MTRPRCLKPGRTYLITRRCSQRQFLLTPGTRLKTIVLYCLARAASRFNIEIHAFIVMSNHYHLVLTDSAEKVRLPKFMAWLNLHIARATNRLRNREENFWAPGSYSAVFLADEASVLDKIVYTLTNAVAANLVRKPNNWPGLHSRVSALGNRKYEALKPSIFFQDCAPKKAGFRLTQPPSLRHMSLELYQSLIDQRVRARVEDLRRARVAAGKTVLGSKAIKAQDPRARPSSTRPQRNLNPRIACKDNETRTHCLRSLKDFWQDYREAWKLWRSGDRRARFPEGTYLMYRLHQACVPMSPPAPT